MEKQECPKSKTGESMAPKWVVRWSQRRDCYSCHKNIITKKAVLLAVLISVPTYRLRWSQIGIATIVTHKIPPPKIYINIKDTGFMAQLLRYYD